MRWTLGILALPLVYAVNVALVVMFDGAFSGERIWPVVVYLAVVIAAFVFAIGLLGRTVREILLTVRLRRQARMFDDGVTARVHHLDPATALGGAGALARRLAAGEAPPAVEASGIDARPEETIYLRCGVELERLAADGVDLPYISGVFTAAPDLLTRGLSEESPGREGPHWSARRPARIAVTNERLLIDAGTGWESIAYPRLTARYPLLARQCFVAVGEGGAPLRITGFAAAQIAVWVEFAISGAAGVQELYEQTFGEPPR